MNDVCLIPEDSSRRTINGILRLLKDISVNIGIHAEFRLIPDHQYYVAASWANVAKREACAKQIAGEIAIHNSLIIVNYDADRKFSPHKSNCPKKTSKKKQIYSLLLESIKNDLIESFCYDETSAQNELSKIVAMVPYWNIESWAYFNKNTLQQLIAKHRINDPHVVSILNEGDSHFDEKKMSIKGINLTDGNFIGKDVFNETLLSTNYPIINNLNIQKSFYSFYNEFKTALENRQLW